MKTLKISLVLAALCLVIKAEAQNLFDVHRYSSTSYQGNARSMATGNAMGALGGTPIATALNPAGLAAYPTSEFSFSFGTANSTVQSGYLGTDRTSNKYSFNVPSVGYVFTEKSKSAIATGSGWFSKHFGITVNRRNGFNSETLFSGTNTGNSMTDFFAEDYDFVWYNNLPIDSTTYGGLGWYSYLVDPLYNEDGEIVDHVPYMSNLSTTDVDQSQLISSRGNITELNLSYAGNYNNQILVGGTIGMPILNFREVRTFTEDNFLRSEDNFNSLTLRERTEDNGVGIYAKAGVIFKPVSYFRFGVALKTPTLYSINRTFDVRLTADTDSAFSDIDPIGYDYNYYMSTSMEANVSAAFLLKGLGFISADYSIYDGSLSGLRGEGSTAAFDYEYQNIDIENGLQVVHKLSLGAEYTYKNFALRGGYSTTSPGFKKGYQPETNMHSPQTVSFGIGYRETRFYMDLGWQTRTQRTFFQPYSLEDADVAGAISNEAHNSTVLTIGFNF